MSIQSRTISAVMAATLLTILSVPGCGGGSNGGITPPPPPPPPPTGGIIRTGVAFVEGPITGFGSIIINGNTYDTSTAVFTKDGQASTQAEFSVGQIVVIRGTIDDDDTNGVAESVEFNDNVEGPVTSVDDVNNVIVVLGQTVQLAAGTSIDDSCPATLNDLLAVPAVEVSGLVRADGVIEATRIECRAALPLEFEVTGVVSNLGATTFNINGLVVDFSAASIDNFPGGVITEGDPVEATGGTTLGAGGELLATRVEFKGARFADDEGDHIEIEGFITRFVSDTDFDVSGIPATTIAGTTFEGGSAADLGLNLKIEVEGEFDALGILNATKIEIKTSTAVRVTGTVDSVDAGNEVLTVLGIVVNTDSLKTRFEDKSSAERDPLTIADIVAGNYVEVRGQELPVGEITAFLVERDEVDALRELRGFVETGGVNRPNLTVLGVTVATDAATVFTDENEVPFANADDFWAAVAEGSLINVNGSQTGAQALLASEVELEME